MPYLFKHISNTNCTSFSVVKCLFLSRTYVYYGVSWYNLKPFEVAEGKIAIGDTRNYVKEVE